MSNTPRSHSETESRIPTAPEILAAGTHVRDATNAIITRQVPLAVLQKFHIQHYLGNYRNEKGGLWGGFDSVVPFETPVKEEGGRLVGTAKPALITSGPFLRDGYEWDPVGAASRWANGPLGLMMPAMLKGMQNSEESVLILPNGDRMNFVASDDRAGEAFDIIVGYYDSLGEKVSIVIFDDKNHSIQEITGTFGIPPEKVKELAAALVYNIRDRGWRTDTVK